jgi:N-acetylmuramic acid 6-phosphate etherase
MAITGSTRMQATSIQLCVMLTVLEMVVRDLAGLESASVPKTFLEKLVEMHAGLKSPEFLAQLSKIVALEESVYRNGRKNNYFADRLGIDVLTDTTERSPTFCTPPFRKFDDNTAAASWAFLFLPDEWTDRAWQNVLKRKPRCIGWITGEIRLLVEAEKVARTLEIVGKIGPAELMRFRIGMNAARFRPQGVGDSAIAVLSAADSDSSVKILATRLKTARGNGSQTALVYFGGDPSSELKTAAKTMVSVPVPKTDFLLDGVTRVAVKLVMNALSTCTMVRLGRVMGNYMIYVVPSNLKLIDRATRYISKLTDLPYERANELLFEVIEYVEPRMKSDQAYPPVVGMAVLRARENLTNEEAEKKLLENNHQCQQRMKCKC